MNLNTFMANVHQNAKEHGWWDDPRTDATIRSLFHCELSEAMESYRRHEAMLWHNCPADHKPCEDQPVHDAALPCADCRPENRKPEGVAVELIDFVIRVFDYLGSVNHVLPPMQVSTELLAAWAADDIQLDDDGVVTALDLPDFVDVLHTHVALSDLMHSATYLVTAVGLVFAWLMNRGLDPDVLMMEKHSYNITRTYKHGGKVC